MTESTATKSTGRWTKIAIWGGIIIILLFLGWGLLKRGESRPVVGNTAPDFSLRLFDGYHNEFEDGTVTLSDLAGRIAVINFWASWCVECKVEAEELEAIWQDYQDKGVVFIGVDYDDTEVKAIEYLESYGITYPNGLDGRGQITENRYHITGVPETFIVAPSGRIAAVKIGAYRSGELRRTLDELLGAQ